MLVAEGAVEAALAQAGGRGDVVHPAPPRNRPDQNWSLVTRRTSPSSKLRGRPMASRYLVLDCLVQNWLRSGRDGQENRPIVRRSGYEERKRHSDLERMGVMSAMDGKTALVTGASSGIGWAIAKRFADDGARVYITGRRKDELEAAAKEIGPDAVAVPSRRLAAPPTSTASWTSSAATDGSSTSWWPTPAWATGPASPTSPRSSSTSSSG